MNAAVIIETRPLKNLTEIINRHFNYLEGWELVFVCGNHNKEHAVEACRNAKGYGKAHIKQVKVDLINAHFYNDLLTQAELWHYLSKFSRVLIFQHDSGLLRKGIEEFLEWDYVGAPWYFQFKGGNGGLSLRNPVMMNRVCVRFPYHSGYGNEDVYFSNKLEDVGGKLAPREVCQKFSVEKLFKLGTLGYHAIESWHDDQQIQRIMNQY